MLSEQLTALKVKNAKPGRHVDGKGLCLVVKPTGAKSWVLRVQADGKRRDIGLGSTDMLTLADAREKAAQGRKWAKQGLDPAFEWKKSRAVIPSFEKAARTYHELHKRGWRNPKHAAQWLSTLVEYAFPKIGNTRLDLIDSAAIVTVLAPIWLEKPETAGRVGQRLATVLNYGHSQGWRTTEAPMKAVAGGLPRRTKTNTKARKHHAAMPYPDLPPFMAALAEKAPTVGRQGLVFTILTAARSGETRGATWGEIDLEAKLWTIPGERMKGGVSHSVPLSDAALAVLSDRKGLVEPKPGDLIFPGSKGALSDATMAKAFREAGGANYTVHGTARSSFRDWAAERTTTPREVAEAALAHSNPNEVEAAYLRTKYLDQRRELMKRWADYLGGSGNVVQLVANHG
ncbi:MAG: site-specific integrase [Alphaproteobacteria bacterium]|nr:MAG: site-specific integrase [Alphaproteobacteria bacterium]